MKFQRHPWTDEPEINFIPLIDVLLVLLIFLTATTTFTRFSELSINLPTAAADEAKMAEISVEITASGQYSVNGIGLAEPGPEALLRALRTAAADADTPLLVLYADAQAAHQTVVDVMQAARAAGISRLSFAARQAGPP